MKLLRIFLTSIAIPICFLNSLAQETSVLMSGTYIPIKIENTVSSKGSNNVIAIINQDIADFEGNKLIAAGTRVELSVIKTKARATGKPGSIKITVVSTTAVDNQIIGLVGDYFTEGQERKNTALWLTGCGCFIIPPVNFLFLFMKGTEATIPASTMITNARVTSSYKINTKHSATGGANISVHRAPPEILITYPIIKNGKATTYKDEIPVAGKITGKNEIKQIMVNGEQVTIAANRTFEKNVKLDDGENTITVIATDIHDKVNKKIFAIIKEEFGAKASVTELVSNEGLSHALLFAIDKYDQWPDLTNPINDARTIADELTKYYGFQAELVENPGMDQIIAKLKQYAKKSYEPNDVLLIFFGGHGHFDDVFKEGYVVAKNSREDDQTNTSYISHSNLRTIINNIPCEHILLVMDVCFGGTFDPIIAASNRGGDGYGEITKTEFIKRKLKYKTRRYLTSGGKEYVPDGRPGHHSPFARKFLEALRSYGGNDGILTINEILSYIEKVNPQPRAGEFGNNEPGSDFIFIAR
ncbi:MAG: caspase family protein [Bacteroidetes bacterium]|nr:caspase family protein [Bacteroidota bacterium]